MCLSNVGVCYGSLGDDYKVIQYQEKAIRILQNLSEMGTRRAEGICYKSISAAYANLNRYRDGINYLEKAIKIFQEIGDKEKEKECQAMLLILREADRIGFEYKRNKGKER